MWDIANDQRSAPKYTQTPSGDQLLAPEALNPARSPLISLSPVPSGCMTLNTVLSPIGRLNASNCPSGDHSGLAAPFGPISPPLPVVASTSRILRTPPARTPAASDLRSGDQTSIWPSPIGGGSTFCATRRRLPPF